MAARSAGMDCATGNVRFRKASVKEASVEEASVEEMSLSLDRVNTEAGRWMLQCKKQIYDRFERKSEDGQNT